MFTLKNFTELDIIKEFTLLNNTISIDNMVINHVCAVEPPAEDFIRMNELVLTTAIGCYDNEELFLGFVKDIYNSGAAAVCLSAKKPYPVLPDSIVKFASDNSFPILFIPWEYRFADIIEAVLDGISYSERQKKAVMEAVQKRLLGNYLSGGTFSTAAKIINDMLECDAVITDDNHIIRGSSTERFVVNDYFNSFDENIIPIELNANSVSYGYLILIPSADEPIDFEYSMLEQNMTAPLSLWFNHETLVRQANKKFMDDFFSRLLSGGFKTTKEIAGECSRLKLRFNPPYTCIVGKIVPKVSSESSEVKMLFHYSAIHKTIDSVMGISGDSQLSPLVYVNDGTIVIFAENRIYSSIQSINRLIDSIEEKLLNDIPFYKYIWGISEISAEMMDLAKKYKNACLALKICIDENFGTNRGTYEDTSIFRILSVLSSNEEIVHSAEKALSKLTEYDKSKNGSLLKTLVVYIKSGFNLSKTASELNLHRQSLLYRMSKIENLTGISLNNHSDMFLMEIYTRLLYNYNEKL